jgi:hypothetical protein
MLEIKTGMPGETMCWEPNDSSDCSQRHKFMLQPDGDDAEFGSSLEVSHKSQR